MRRLSVALLGTGMIAACVSAPAKQDLRTDRHGLSQARVVEELQGLKPSAPQNCIDSYSLRNVQGESFGDTLLYHISSRLVYRNDTSGGCYGLAHGDTLNDQNYPGNQIANTKLCRGDRLDSVNVRVPGATGSCTRGPWVAYTK